MVVSDREKTIKNCQVSVVEMNESEPSMKCRNGNPMLSKPNSECMLGISLDVSWTTGKAVVDIKALN